LQSFLLNLCLSIMGQHSRFATKCNPWLSWPRIQINHHIKWYFEWIGTSFGLSARWTLTSFLQ
jgi:hypothetical protein